MKVQAGHIHPKTTGITFLGKCLNFRCLGEGLEECRAEACPFFYTFH